MKQTAATSASRRSPPQFPSNPNYIDYTSALKDVLLESENQGLSFRYTYGLEKFSVSVNGNGFNNTKAYFHHDRLGSVDFTTAELGNVLSCVTYDAWGIPTSVSPWNLGARKIDLVAEYATHSFDAVLSMYFAEARLYDPSDRRFAAVDPLHGSIANPLSLNRYVYVLDNPTKYVDPLGLMPVKWLRAIKNAYILGEIPEDSVGSIVMIANIVSLSTDFIEKASSLFRSDLREFYDIFTEAEQELKDSSPSRQVIYIAFHETAQILAAKEIYQTYSYLSNSHNFFPELEVLTSLNKEMDIVFGDYVWEVKPGYTSTWAFNSSLRKYVNGYSPSKEQNQYKLSILDRFNGFKIPGASFNGKRVKLFELNGTNTYMTVKWLGLGKIGYFFELECEQKQLKEVKAVDVAPLLLPAFEYADGLNEMTEMGVTVLAFIATILDGVPGDEIVTGGLLSKTMESFYKLLMA